jgi:hypothetical protein
MSQISISLDGFGSLSKSLLLFKVWAESVAYLESLMHPVKEFRQHERGVKTARDFVSVRLTDLCLIYFVPAR